MNPTSGRVLQETTLAEVTVALGSIFALIGVIIGQLLSRGGEYRKWLRTERHTACARLLEVCESLSVRATSGDALRTVAKRNAEALTVESVPKARQLMDEIFKRYAEESGLPEEQIRSIRAETERQMAPKIADAVRQTIVTKFEGDPAGWLSDYHKSFERVMFARESLRLVAPAAVIEAAEDLAGKAIALTTDDLATFSERVEQYKASRRHFVDVATGFLHGRLTSLWPKRG